MCMCVWGGGLFLGSGKLPFSEAKANNFYEKDAKKMKIFVRQVTPLTPKPE